MLCCDLLCFAVFVFCDVVISCAMLCYALLCFAFAFTLVCIAAYACYALHIICHVPGTW